MSTSPFGSPPPPAPGPSSAPAGPPAAAGGRPTALLVVLGAVVALAVTGGAAFLLLGGAPDDQAAPVSVLATSAPAPSATPSASPTPAPTRSVSAARNPFVPLVAPVAAAAPSDPAGGVAADPAGTDVSVTAPSGAGGGAAKPVKPSTPTPSPTSSAPAGMDLQETCFVAVDALDIVDTALDPALSLTSTAAGSAMGQSVLDLTEAAGTTTVASLKPLLGTAVTQVTAVRTALLAGTERSAVDLAAYSAARDGVVDQCAVLLDPLGGK